MLMVRHHMVKNKTNTSWCSVSVKGASIMSVVEPVSPVLKTPEWLEALENKRNRPHKLAHDIGAGAPCLVCKDGCKGLNLHFWRKLCIECKCRKEDHEIQEEEDYAQFEILFGAKKVKRTTLKFNAQTKSFDWIPPNVSHDLAVDYLKSIPQSKLPISNTEGARYRKQQLEKQVPLHDVDPNACFNLSDGEMKEFGKYLDNLKINVIGQGKILKYQSPKLLKENYISDTSPDMLATSGGCTNIKPQGVEVLGHLKIDKVLGYNASSESLNPESYLADITLPKHPQAGNNLQSLKINPLEENGNRNQNSTLNVDKSFTLPKPYHPTNISKGDLNPEIFNRLEGYPSLKKPSSFVKKYVVDNQNNYKQVEDNCNEGLAQQAQPTHNNLPFQQTPYDASYDPLRKFSNLSISSSEVPFVPIQESQIIQTPKQIQTQKSLESNLDTFPSPPAICQQCLEILNPEEIVIQTERAGTAALWHAQCFVCCTCKELLVDLMYFYHKEKVYCGRHYAEVMKIPRCYGCDELIFVKEYTVAEGESYHVRHFCCFHCDKPLGGQQYIPKDNYPVCLDCYQLKYGKNCRTCGLAIGAGEQRVSWKDLDFHASPKCFRCAGCSKSLLGGKFTVKNENTFCSKECVLQFPG